MLPGLLRATPGSPSILGEVATLQTPDLSGRIVMTGGYAFAIGEFSDVYKYRSRERNTLTLAVKVLRGVSFDPLVRKAFIQRLSGLVSQWQKMCHQNIMPCFGTILDFGPVPAPVYPFCPYGSIMKYVRDDPDADHLQLVTQVASGLSYLHSHGFVHGDIRGANILISNDKTPLLMDGGLSFIVSRTEFTSASICGPCRWMPPEVLDPKDEVDSEEYISPFEARSDVYSFGMTILEILTGKVPFCHRRMDTVVILDVISGLRPIRPEGIFSDELWNILKACWKDSPNERPAASHVERWLSTVYCMKKMCSVASFGLS